MSRAYRTGVTSRWEVRFPSIRVRVPGCFTALVDRQLLVQPRDHFSNTRLGEAFRAARVIFLQAYESLLEQAELFLGFFILGRAGDHNSISTSLLRCRW